MPFDDSPRNCQTQACSLMLGGDEGAEDFGELIIGYSRTRILDVDVHVGTHLAGGDFEHSPRLHGLNAVQGEVDQRLGHQLRVDQNLCFTTSGAGLDADSGLVGLGPHERDRSPHQV